MPTAGTSQSAIHGYRLTRFVLLYKNSIFFRNVWRVQGRPHFPNSFSHRLFRSAFGIERTCLFHPSLSSCPSVSFLFALYCFQLEVGKFRISLHEHHSFQCLVLIWSLIHLTSDYQVQPNYPSHKTFIKRWEILGGVCADICADMKLLKYGMKILPMFFW